MKEVCTSEESGHDQDERITSNLLREAPATLPCDEQETAQTPSSAALTKFQGQNLGNVSVSSDQHPICTTSTLYVGNLSPQIAEVHLQKLFQAYGQVKRVHLVKSSRSTTGTTGGIGGWGDSLNNNSSSVRQQKGVFMGGFNKGYGFVEFDSVSSATLAMHRVHGRVLLGRTLVVRPSRDNEKAKGHTGAAPASVASLPQNLDNPHAIKREKANLDSKIASVKRALEARKNSSLADQKRSRLESG